MLRVLHVIPRLFAGGEQVTIMNWYRNIDREIIQFDFVVWCDEKGIFEDEVVRYCGRIYHSPKYNGINHLDYCKWWDDFFLKHPEYTIVHGHIRSTASIYLKIAKKHGCYTIAHSHSISNGAGVTSFAKFVMQLPIRYIADFCMACSEEAGKYLFGNRVTKSSKYKMLPNGINCDIFAFNQSIRERVRNDLGVEDCLVIGQVGRFSKVKNHEFTLKVFREILMKRNNAKLLLVGDGNLKEDIINQCADYDIIDDVIFVGEQYNVEQYYQAMDVLVLPSLYEGLGLVAIEAQAEGLYTICSEKIPFEVKKTELCEFSPLDCSEWVRRILGVHGRNRTGYNLVIKEAGYDVCDIANWLQKFYLMHRKA